MHIQHRKTFENIPVFSEKTYTDIVIRAKVPNLNTEEGSCSRNKPRFEISKHVLKLYQSESFLTKHT